MTLLIGVNNQYRGYAQDEYAVEFTALLEQAIQFGGGEPGRSIVLSIPDWGMTPFAGKDPRSAEKITAEATLIADYESCFTGEQMQKAMDVLSDSGLEIKDAS